MKKYIIFSIMLISMFAAGLHASLEEDNSSRWYFGGIAGVNHINSTNVGAQLGFSIGYKLSPSFRLEWETVSRVNKIKETGANFTTSVSAINIIYDLKLNLPFKPYIGLGMGPQYRVFSFDEEGYLFQIEERATAYQGMFGTYIPLSEKVFTCLEYRIVGNNMGSEVSHSAGLNIKRYF